MCGPVTPAHHKWRPVGPPGTSRVVNYTLSIEGVTAGPSTEAFFSGYTGIRNRASSPYSGSEVLSFAVPPPTSFVIPEAPFAVLLRISAGLLAAGYVLRRSCSRT